MIGGRIDPSSCLDTCWVDNMAVWWFRATCFHGLKYLCVNREVLKQNYIMRTEMKASNEFLYPTDVFLISCGMGCKRITVSDIAYIEAMKDNCIIHMVDGKRYTQSCPMGDIEPELNPNMFKRIHRSFIVNIRYIDMYYYGYVVLENGMEVHIGVVDADCGNILKFTSANRWADKATATNIYNKVKETGSAIITKVATKRKVEKAPLLYDLTTLQKEANFWYSEILIIPIFRT